jgi:hypothetical protein
MESRRHIRFPVGLACSWTRDARVTDVSLGGCYIDCRLVPAVGDEVQIDLSTDDGPLPVQGTVVHAKRNFGFAIRFTAMDEAALNRLSSLLSAAAR